MITITNIKIKISSLTKIKDLIQEHIRSLPFPLDSYLEDLLISSDIYSFEYNDLNIGYFAVKNNTINFFYVKKEYFKVAPALLERLIKDYSIERVHILTQDSLLNRLIIEWDYEKKMEGCYFVDSKKGNCNILDADWVFRQSTVSDEMKIKQIAGDFFDEASGGFEDVLQRIKANTMFVLESKKGTLGYGVIEKGRLVKNSVSIGMFVNPLFRKMGAAKTILNNLKKWAYDNNLEPLAGCWFYNTLSRKSLEAAGMTIASIGYEAIIKGKEILPLRTGNPPGELVE